MRAIAKKSTDQTAHCFQRHVVTLFRVAVTLHVVELQKVRSRGIVRGMRVLCAVIDCVLYVVFVFVFVWRFSIEW